MNYHRDLCTVSCVCAALSVNGGAQSRPKVKTKWPMNVRGEDLSQAPPALTYTPEDQRLPRRPLSPVPIPSYISGVHCMQMQTIPTNRTERASAWTGIATGKYLLQWDLFGLWAAVNL